MKILITGGAGYIGSHAVKRLLEEDHQIVVVDNLYRGYRQVVDVLQEKFGRKNLSFYQADLMDSKKINKIFLQENPGGVMHFAALCLIDESMENPGKYFENNVGGGLNLLEAMIDNKVDNLVFSSTCAVYGKSHYLPIDEKHPTQPINPYGESKLMFERIIKWFGEIKGLRYAILRYFNVAGAASDGLIGDSKKPSQLLIQNAVRGALKIEPFRLTCPKVDTRDGTPIRDYINIEDLVEAHLKALSYLEKDGKSDVFNLGTGTGNSVLEVVKQVHRITGVNFPIKKGKARKGEYAKIYADIRKSKRILKWWPTRSIEDSILSLVRWYRHHPQGWEY